MAIFGRVAPTVPVTDIDHALRFYRDVLGFEVTFTNGDPVSFAVIHQGEAELHLGIQPGRAGSTHSHLMVDDLDSIHDALQLAGVPIRQPPMVQPWGLRDLVVADPDGNTFEIAEPVFVAPCRPVSPSQTRETISDYGTGRACEVMNTSHHQDR